MLPNLHPLQTGGPLGYLEAGEYSATAQQW